MNIMNRENKIEKYFLQVDILYNCTRKKFKSNSSFSRKYVKN